jgi:hypothetical protein
MKRITWLVLAMAALAGSTGAVPFVTLGLNPPNGFLAGLPGTSVGWGYTLSTDSDYVSIQDVGFDNWTPVGSVPTPNVPVTMAAVGSPIISPWVQDTSGLQYDIWPGAVLGSSSMGGIWVVYDAFEDTGDGPGEQTVYGDTVYARLDGEDVIAEVYVVPEPGTMILLGAGLATALLLRRRLA